MSIRNAIQVGVWVLLVLSTVNAFSADSDKYPTLGDVLKCPKCNAEYDGKPHVQDYQKCPKCKAALEKATAYLKKNFNPGNFGLLLDSFFAGFAFMMDGENNEKELAICQKNCRTMIKPEKEGDSANTAWGNSNNNGNLAGGWSSWKKSMAMYFLAEYSLRYGLTPENKAALIEGAKYATETQQKGGGWFHGFYTSKPYTPDVAIIGCIYYAAFLEMKTLGVDPGPILDQTRTYLEGVSDGKTIGYCKGWHGGMGGGGADGFITLGLQGSGNSNDKWGAGLGLWMEKNYMDCAHGHAYGALHYFGMGAGLHRLGADYYSKFASCQIHRLIDIQKEDGTIPKMAALNGSGKEYEYFQKAKNEPGDYSQTAVLACLILMERPGVFSRLPGIDYTLLSPTLKAAYDSFFKQHKYPKEAIDYLRKNGAQDTTASTAPVKPERLAAGKMYAFVQKQVIDPALEPIVALCKTGDLYQTQLKLADVEKLFGTAAVHDSPLSNEMGSALSAPNAKDLIAMGKLYYALTAEIDSARSPAGRMYSTHASMEKKLDRLRAEFAESKTECIYKTMAAEKLAAIAKEDAPKAIAKPSDSKAVTVAAKPAAVTHVSKEELAKWDARLSGCVKSMIQHKGKPVEFEKEGSQGRSQIAGLDNQGRFRVVGDGLDIYFEFRNLSLADKAGIAVAVANKSEKEDCAMAYFYLTACGRGKKASEYQGTFSTMN